MHPNRTRVRNRTLLVVGVTLVAVSGSPRPAQAQTDGSLLKSDLVRMMTGDSYTAEEVLQIVRMNCVGFQPSDRDRKDLSRLFDGDALINEIDRCRKVGQADGYRRGVPVARTAKSVAVPSGPAAEGPSFAPPSLTTDGIAPPNLERPPVGDHAPSDTMPGVSPSAPPRLLNWEYVTKRIRSEYRPDRRHSGEVVLRIWVDEQGHAGEASVVDAEGDPALARVVLAAVPLMRFAPAESRDRKVGAWASLPIRFRTD